MMDSIVLEEASSSATYGRGGRAIDRYNPIIRDEKRLNQGRIFPSSSTFTITSTTTDQLYHHHLHNLKPESEASDQKRKSVAFADDEFIKASNLISPASSSRCLLSDKATFTFSPEFHHVSPPATPQPLLPPREYHNSHNGKDFEKKDDDLLSSPPPHPPPPPTPQPPPCDGDNESLSSSTTKPSPSPPPEPLKFHNSKVSSMKRQDSLSSSVPKPPSQQPPQPTSDQVIVLEVSLHCRGCERKMKKHISKIEGVTSFKIEFAAKKVTVIGDVTPLAVLTSVLKVKNAKLLTPATIASSSSQTKSNRS